MSESTGTRLYVDECGNVPREKLVPGCYVWWPLDEIWWVVAPNGAEGRLKSNHVVTEHKDGTTESNRCAPSRARLENERGPIAGAFLLVEIDPTAGYSLPAVFSFVFQCAP